MVELARPPKQYMRIRSKTHSRGSTEIARLGMSNTAMLNLLDPQRKLWFALGSGLLQPDDPDFAGETSLCNS